MYLFSWIYECFSYYILYFSEKIYIWLELNSTTSVFLCLSNFKLTVNDNIKNHAFETGNQN